MKKILVIEDEDIAAKRLINIIKRLMPNSEISGPLDSISGSISYLSNNPPPDLLFLDIHLADGMSFEIFEHVKIPSPIIFTTAFDEFAIKAFELNSIDYLLKPIDKKKLAASIVKYNSINKYYSQSDEMLQLKSIILSLNANSSKYKSRFLVSKGDLLFPIQTDTIAYFIAEDKVVQLYTSDNKKYIINYTLDSLEEKLDPEYFFRINRHCIISLKSVHKVHNYFNYKLKIEVIPPSSEELIVSKSRTTEFKQWMNN